MAAIATTLATMLLITVASASTDTLQPNQALNPGQQLVSPSGNAQLNVQTSDGNVVLYHAGAPLWSSGTTGHAGDRMYMQGDGNLVVQVNGTGALWASNTAGHANAFAQLRDDCTLAVIEQGGTVLWSTPQTCAAPAPTPPPSPSPPTPPPGPSPPVDASTIKNKVLCGYQGWFGTTPGSPAGYDWRHWSTNSNNAPGPGTAQFDLFPDLSEYPPDALSPTALKYANGDAVGLYATSRPGVVDLHAKWMQQYGLDGVLVQRFLTEVSQAGSPWATQHNDVLAQVAASAQARGRVFAAMWDASGAPNGNGGWAAMVKNDWANVVANHTSNPAYLHEGGKPVVALFGLGLANHAPTPSASDAVALINWLKQRAYVIGSGPYWWRAGGHDALPASAGYAAVHAAFDAVMPWSVGRYASAAGFKATDLAAADGAFCAARGQAYSPIAFPGYSFHNTDASKPLNSIPRAGGALFQAQIDAYLAVDGAAFRPGRLPASKVGRTSSMSGSV